MSYIIQKLYFKIYFKKRTIKITFKRSKILFKILLMFFESFQVRRKTAHIVLSYIHFLETGNSLPIISLLPVKTCHTAFNIKQRDLSIAINFYPLSIHKEKCVFFQELTD